MDARPDARNARGHDRHLHHQACRPATIWQLRLTTGWPKNWQDDRVIASLRQLATRFTLREAESRTLNLRVSPLKR
jgi:hypothetical protein